jgi:hypothetical protein
MSTAVKEMGRVELVNLERLAYLLKGLSATELETLELLLDEDVLPIGYIESLTRICSVKLKRKRGKCQKTPIGMRI